MIYKRYTSLRVNIKTTCFGHIWPSSGFMSIKISPYKLRELHYDVEISPSNYCRKYIYYVQADTMLDWYVVSLRWYRGLILGCVECRHGVSNWMSSCLSSRKLLLWGCLWMTLAGTFSHVWWSPCVSVVAVRTSRLVRILCGLRCGFFKCAVLTRILG